MFLLHQLLISSIIKKNRDLIERLRTHGLTLEYKDLTNEAQGIRPEFLGKTWILTGKLRYIQRADASKSIVQRLRGSIHQNVTKATNCCVLGRFPLDRPSWKLKRVQDYGLKVLNEEEFLDIMYPNKKENPFYQKIELQREKDLRRKARTQESVIIQSAKM